MLVGLAIEDVYIGSRFHILCSVRSSGIKVGPSMLLEFDDLHSAAQTLSGLTCTDHVDIHERLLDLTGVRA